MTFMKDDDDVVGGYNDEWSEQLQEVPKVCCPYNSKENDDDADTPLPSSAVLSTTVVKHVFKLMCTPTCKNNGTATSIRSTTNITDGSSSSSVEPIAGRSSRISKENRVGPMQVASWDESLDAMETYNNAARTWHRADEAARLAAIGYARAIRNAHDAANLVMVTARNPSPVADESSVAMVNAADQNAAAKAAIARKSAEKYAIMASIAESAARNFGTAARNMEDHGVRVPKANEIYAAAEASAEYFAREHADAAQNAAEYALPADYTASFWEETAAKGRAGVADGGSGDYTKTAHATAASTDATGKPATLPLQFYDNFAAAAAGDNTAKSTANTHLSSSGGDNNNKNVAALALGDSASKYYLASEGENRIPFGENQVDEVFSPRSSFDILSPRSSLNLDYHLAPEGVNRVPFGAVFLHDVDLDGPAAGVVDGSSKSASAAGSRAIVNNIVDCNGNNGLRSRRLVKGCPPQQSSAADNNAATGGTTSTASLDNTNNRARPTSPSSSSYGGAITGKFENNNANINADFQSSILSMDENYFDVKPALGTNTVIEKNNPDFRPSVLSFDEHYFDVNNPLNNDARPSTPILGTNAAIEKNNPDFRPSMLSFDEDHATTAVVNNNAVNNNDARPSTPILGTNTAIEENNPDFRPSILSFDEDHATTAVVDNNAVNNNDARPSTPSLGTNTAIRGNNHDFRSSVLSFDEIGGVAAAAAEGDTVVLNSAATNAATDNAPRPPPRRTSSRTFKSILKKFKYAPALLAAVAAPVWLLGGLSGLGVDSPFGWNAC